MGVYIKGIEMPKSCRECPLATRFFDGEDVCAMLGTYVHDRDREDDCPLVPVPEPHGDLIDRDKLRAKEFIHNGDAYAVVMSRDIRNAPTVIPESEEGE